MNWNVVAGLLLFAASAFSAAIPVMGTVNDLHGFPSDDGCNITLAGVDTVFFLSLNIDQTLHCEFGGGNLNTRLAIGFSSGGGWFHVSLGGGGGSVTYYDNPVDRNVTSTTDLISWVSFVARDNTGSPDYADHFVVTATEPPPAPLPEPAYAGILSLLLAGMGVGKRLTSAKTSRVGLVDR